MIRYAFLDCWGAQEVLCNESAPAIEWVIEKFGIDLSLVSQLGGHSAARTHRGKERFPGRRPEKTSAAA
eukprot:542273-Amphidinium_carterae.1